MTKLARRFETALLPLGVLALGILIWKIGPEERAQLLALIERARWWFVVIVAQGVVCHALNTWGLTACLPLDRKSLGFLYTFAARLAGEGVNATVPTGTVGGELLKIALLTKRAPTDRVTAGISAAYANQALGQMLFSLVFLPVALPRLDLPPTVKAIIVVFVVGGVVATWILASVTRKGSFEKIHGLLRLVGLGRTGSRAHAATTAIDGAAKEARSADPRGFVLSVLAFFLGWLFGVVEVALCFHACGRSVDLVQCTAIESLSTFVDAVFFFVPGQMGTREYGLVGIMRAMGVDEATGLALALIRRARVLVWAGLGMACLAVLRRTEPTSAPEVSQPSVNVH